MALIVKDGNGIVGQLDSSAVAAGIGTTEIGREFEVAGFIITRLLADGIGPAAGLASEADGLGSLWTNASYNPSTVPDDQEPGRRWRRTINMKNGNVGIGRQKDVADATVNPEDPQEKLVVAGNILATGDVILTGADCAEEFDVEDGDTPAPGAVMVINGEEKLRQCKDAYDSRVAGVISGAGCCRPGVVLGRRASCQRRIPLALTGKVYCRVDASYGAVGIGDLLTTSCTPGHAMRVVDPARAFGAILGKALRPLGHGRGLVPILIALQ